MSINGIEFKKWVSPTDDRIKLRVEIGNDGRVVAEFRHGAPQVYANAVILAVELHDELVRALEMVTNSADVPINLEAYVRGLLARARP